MTKLKKQQGFTIIELMISAVVFSIVLLICLTSFLQVGRIFYKGVTMSRSNEIARDVTDNISNDMRSSGTLPIVHAGASSGLVCIGGHRYTYNLFVEPSSSTPALSQDNITSGSCSAAAAGTGAQELLDSNMRLFKFEVAPCATGSVSSKARCVISINIVRGDDDVLSDSAAASHDQDATCDGNLLSTQFCATASLTTRVFEGE